jgi:hypothetical protein
MRTLKAIVTPALVLAAACENGTSELVGPQVNFAKAAARKMVPFKGSMTMQASDAKVPGCGGQGATLTKAGHATHLGRFTAFSTQCADATGITGQTTFTAANGDQLRVTYSVTVDPSSSFPDLRTGLVLTVTGGTGRFEGATGRITGVGAFNALTGVGSASLVGVISKPRSDEDNDDG